MGSLQLVTDAKAHICENGPDDLSSMTGKYHVATWLFLTITAISVTPILP